MCFDYNQHAAPHHSIFIYCHAMNPMKSLSTSHWTQLISKLLTYQHQNSEYGSTWKIIGMEPYFITWSIYHQYPLRSSTNRWSTVTDPLTHVCLWWVNRKNCSVWTLFSHAGVYVTAIGWPIPAWLGVFCCYFFWCQPARLVCQPWQSGFTWYTIVDDNVEAAPIYRCDSKAGQPIVRPHENHDLDMELETTQTESWQKQQIQSRAVPASGSLDTTKIREHHNNIWPVVRPRFGPVATSLNSFDELTLKGNSCFTHHHVYHS